jgi:hypothetical protein
VADFIPGLQLSELFYQEAVGPLLAADFPGLRYSAALIGSGSEVLGFDTPMSTDHHWGPRLLLFLDESESVHIVRAIDGMLRHKLPHRFRGYATNFTPPDPADNGVQLLQATDQGPINHRVEIVTLGGYFGDYLAFDIRGPLEPADWLTFPEQKLRTVIEGRVFHDGLGLQAVRERFAYYPHDVWLYLLAAGWARIGQEEHLTGRAGLVGDELGSALIACRLVRDLMRLCFLMERQYAPYAKWFGTAFARLACGPRLAPILLAAQIGATWQERERPLVAAYEQVADMHNRLGITEPLPGQVTPFFGRPFRVIWGGRYADAIKARIIDPAVVRIAARRPVGGIDQFSDSTDLAEDTSRRAALRELYGEETS